MNTNEVNLVVQVPHQFVQGEPGEPLDPVVENIVNALATTGWFVIDFGEAKDTYTELLFMWAPDEALEGAKHFIACGGDV